MTLQDLLEPDVYDPALPTLTTAERITLSHAISSRRQAEYLKAAALNGPMLRDALAIAAIGELSGRLLAGREDREAGERNKAIRRMVRDAYLIADQALVERAK